jgi:plasmid stabilization system protein ParE
VPGYILSPEAEQDLLEIRAYYLTQANARVPGML